MGKTKQKMDKRLERGSPIQEKLIGTMAQTYVGKEACEKELERREGTLVALQIVEDSK